MNLSNRQQQILISLLRGNRSLPQLINLPMFADVTERTLQRDIGELVEAGLIDRSGEARAIVYEVNLRGRLELVLPESALEEFFADEAREHVSYDFERLDALRSADLFSVDEQNRLTEFNQIYSTKLQTAPTDIVRRERERITVELSWKSSQLEGNTYTLLETESLIKDGIPGTGRTEQETTMVLNHKKALDFTEQHKELFTSSCDFQTILELHKILTAGLDIGIGLRERLVGITGSVYTPLDNKFQIQEELVKFCEVVNAKENVFEKALLAFVYICYLQPFNDGNKRTARILANAILYSNDSFPLSLRAVSVNTYKLSILAFYELGILGNVKKVFIGQAQFASENYTS
jgi:Fic family protein